MRFRPPSSRPRVLEGELTPLVDMVFLLIIFFLTTSTFIERTKADVELPSEKGEGTQEVRTGSVIINITRNGTLVVGGAYISPDELSERLETEIASGTPAGELDLIVRADRRAELSHINAVAERLDRLGITRWRLATAVPINGGEP